MSVRTMRRVTQSDSDTSNDMSYKDVCAIASKGYKASKGTGEKGSNGIREHGIVERGADEWDERQWRRRRQEGGKKGSQPDWYGEKDRGGTGN